MIRRSLCAVVAALMAVSPASGQQLLDSTSLAALRFRYIGPVGNRIASVAGVTGAPNVSCAGPASGGLWKTVDAGIHWTPIFDAQDVSSVGALAVAASK